MSSIGTFSAFYNYHSATSRLDPNVSLGSETGLRPVIASVPLKKEGLQPQQPSFRGLTEPPESQPPSPEDKTYWKAIIDLALGHWEFHA